MKKGEVKTVQRILRNKHNVERYGVRIYKCGKCEGTEAFPKSTICKDRSCKGELFYHRTIPKEKVEEITSRRAARQCPSCMKLFYIWVESCPFCSTPTLEGRLLNKDKDKLAKLYEHRMVN